MKCTEFSLWAATVIFSFAIKGSQELRICSVTYKKGLRIKKCRSIHHKKERKILNSGTSLLKLHHYLLKTGIQYSLIRNSILCRTSIKLQFLQASI